MDDVHRDSSHKETTISRKGNQYNHYKKTTTINLTLPLMRSTPSERSPRPPRVPRRQASQLRRPWRRQRGPSSLPPPVTTKHIKNRAQYIWSSCLSCYHVDYVRHVHRVNSSCLSCPIFSSSTCHNQAHNSS